MAAAKKSFNEILNSLEEKHSKVLMNRARLANRIAKQVQGRNRRRVYAVKHGALTTLIEKLPTRVSVSTDHKLTDFVVVGLANNYSGLHMPANLV